MGQLILNIVRIVVETHSVLKRGFNNVRKEFFFYASKPFSKGLHILLTTLLAFPG